MLPKNRRKSEPPEGYKQHCYNEKKQPPSIHVWRWSDGSHYKLREMSAQFTVLATALSCLADKSRV
jgi:hypothetical protein